MDYKTIIHDIEDESIILDNEYYYHAFQYTQPEFISMIVEGIKAPILLGKEGQGNNGKFYVCLSKKEKCEKPSYDIYDILSKNPMFVINRKIKTIKSKNALKEAHHPLSFIQSPLPFRESSYDNEYQKFLKVSPKDILAIQYNLFSNYQCYQNNNNYMKHQLLILKQMIEDLESQNKPLPIVDASTSTIINKEKVLSLKI